MYAGLCNASGEYIAIMDTDLQDSPELLPEMVPVLDEEKYECAATYRKTSKGEPLIRNWFAERFYKIINRISDTEIKDGARDFRLMRNEMRDTIIRMIEYNRFSKGIFEWVEFKTYRFPYENVKCFAGKTKWSFWKLCHYAVDGFIVFSNATLNIVSWFGFTMMGLAFVMLIFIVIRKQCFGDHAVGWASPIYYVPQILDI